MTAMLADTHTSDRWCPLNPDKPLVTVIRSGMLISICKRWLVGRGVCAGGPPPHPPRRTPTPDTPTPSPRGGGQHVERASEAPCPAPSRDVETPCPLPPRRDAEAGAGGRRVSSALPLAPPSRHRFGAPHPAPHPLAGSASYVAKPGRAESVPPADSGPDRSEGIPGVVASRPAT